MLAGVRCTHVDALRFFADDAKPLNRYGDLARADQIRIEQVLTCIPGTKVLAYWYKSTNADT